MGDMSELYEMDPIDYDVEEYFNNGSDWLVTHTKTSRDPKILSIRKQWNNGFELSDKQKWVLAYWVSEKGCY